MSPHEMAEERRDALEDMGELARTSACRHYFGNYYSCAMCGALAEEAGYVA